MCPTCGKNPCACGKSKTTISVSLTEETRKALEEVALLKERLRDSEANQIAANEALATAEKIISDAEEKRKEYVKAHPPTGKATMSLEGGGDAETFKDKRELVDHLYDVGHFHSADHTKEEVAKARSQIDTLWQSYLDSPSRKTLMDEGIGALGRTHFMACPKCSYTIDLLHENSCSHCGFLVKGEDLKSERRA